MTAEPGQADRVLELLLMNRRRTEQDERGTVAVAVRRSVDDPNELWRYETSESEVHESGDASRDYNDQLRSLVDGDTVLFARRRRRRCHTSGRTWTRVRTGMDHRPR
jgi:quinol monooxygenase YgiN